MDAIMDDDDLFGKEIELTAKESSLFLQFESQINDHWDKIVGDDPYSVNQTSLLLGFLVGRGVELDRALVIQHSLFP